MEPSEQKLKNLFLKLKTKCPQKCIDDLLTSKPLTHDQLLKVYGINKSFAVKYGTAIIKFFEEDYHQNLFESLKVIRSNIAHELCVSPYFLVSTECLQKIAYDIDFQNVPYNENYKYFTKEICHAREKFYMLRSIDQTLI